MRSWDLYDLPYLVYRNGVGKGRRWKAPHKGVSDTLHKGVKNTNRLTERQYDHEVKLRET